MIKIIVLVFIFATSPICYANDFDDLPEVKALQKGMPEDVATFIPRVVECNHFGGEDAYDKDRAEYLKKSVEEAGCGNIPKNEANLRQKYKNNPKVLDAIQKAKDVMI